VSSTKKNYVFNLLLTIVNLIFPVISFPYAARILGPIGIGKIQFVTSFAQYFALVAALGIPIYGIREIAKVQKNRLLLNRTFSELIFIYVITSIVLSLAYLITIITIDKFSTDLSLYFASTGIVFLGFCSIDWFYAGIEQFKIIALRSVIIKALSLMLLYGFVKEPNDVFIYLLINLFSLIGNNVISILLVWKNVNITTEGLNFKRHVKPLMFIFSTSLASSMYTLLDVVILGFLSSDKSVGYYSAGVKLAKITIPFVTSLGAVTMSQISFNLHENNLDNFYGLLNKSFKFVSFIAVPISFGLFLLSREAIIIFSGSKFLPAEGVMQVLSLLPLVIGFGYFFGIQILITSGKDRQMFVSVCVGMVVSILLNFILIPFFNEIGAAYANIVSEVFVTIAYVYFVNKSFNFKIPYASVLEAVCSCISFIPIVIVLRAEFSNMILQVIFTVLSCSILYVIMQYFVFKSEISVMISKTIISKLKTKRI